MKTLLTSILLFVGVAMLGAQTIPADRLVDWTLAGIKDTTTLNFNLLDVTANGLSSDGTTLNDAPLNALLSTHSEPIILYFPAGTYLFNDPIVLRSNVIMKGAGASSTILKLDLGGTGHGIVAHGSIVLNDTTGIYAAPKNTSVIRVNNASLFSAGDWIRLVQQDSDLVFSNWGLNTVGQIIQIDAIQGDSIYLSSPLRMDYPSNRLPFARKMNPIQNVGIECLKLQRMDNAAPEQASNVHFEFAANCWINGIESVNTTFAHVEVTTSSNVSITNSFIHDAFDFGGGGRAYGVMLHFTSNECLVYNNIFKHLRHSMILQAGANGNVFAYNHSIEPYWTGSAFLPADAAGDMVLHGNYPYANLFEQNDGQNMVIDNSHGANGPHNTYFRNRGSLFGIFFSDATSPNQNLVGNEITNTGFPYSSINYSIQGTGHFIYGNNNKGTIAPTGTSTLPDSTYCFLSRPTEIPELFWRTIGTPNALNSGSIPATFNYNQGDYFSTACGGNSSVSLEERSTDGLKIYPNPVESNGDIKLNGSWEKITCFNQQGAVVFEKQYEGQDSIFLNGNMAGLYFLQVESRHHADQFIKLIVRP